MSDDASLSVPVSVLEALASEWEDQGRRMRPDEDESAFEGRSSALEWCARQLREAMARSGQQ